MNSGSFKNLNLQTISSQIIYKLDLGLNELQKNKSTWKKIRMKINANKKKRKKKPL